MSGKWMPGPNAHWQKAAQKALNTFRKKGFPAPQGRKPHRKGFRTTQPVNHHQSMLNASRKWRKKVRETQPERYAKWLEKARIRKAGYYKKEKASPWWNAIKAKRYAKQYAKKKAVRTLNRFRRKGFPRHQ